MERHNVTWRGYGTASASRSSAVIGVGADVRTANRGSSNRGPLTTSSLTTRSAIE
jgi:hypothetical protein